MYSFYQFIFHNYHLLFTIYTLYHRYKFRSIFYTKFHIIFKLKKEHQF
nr:MAG TPA: hypothetical protein [Caudoviricetes sp.]